MRVLFGINSDNNVNKIVKYYEKIYGEKIEFKSAYYFKQFKEELSSGDYDRAVLKEDLEEQIVKSYAEADKRMYEYISGLTDFFDSKNIIIVGNERRKVGDSFLSSLYWLGVYSVLTGSNRVVSKICEYIHSPVKKRDVRNIYDPNNTGKSSNDNEYTTNSVEESQIRNIISYYENLKGDTSKYNEIFDRIVSQYTTDQMAVIIKFLPKDVKDYLSQNNESYKNIVDSTKAIVTDEQQKPQESIIDKKDNASGIQIEKNNNIQEKIIVKEVPKEKIVIKEVPKEKIVEKEVPKIITQYKEEVVERKIYDVPEDYKKTVIFVGAPKTGTTFCINAIGTYLAKKKVKTAIVDLTRKRDTYTIYTYENTGKRNIAADSLRYASNGKNEPLNYEKLSIYTAVPGEDRKSYNPSLLNETVSKNNSVVLIDADFSTPLDYFRMAQDIYIVQDMNVLNISQVTLFLRELKQRGIEMNKIKIIINKYVNCSLSAKDLVDGLAMYTSYDLKSFDELFNPKKIQFFILPFDVENYKKYIDMVYKYSNKFSSFTQDFQDNLAQVINTIYPTMGAEKVEENTYTEEDDSKDKKKGFFFFGRK